MVNSHVLGGRGVGVQKKGLRRGGRLKGGRAQYGAQLNKEAEVDGRLSMGQGLE